MNFDITLPLFKEWKIRTVRLNVYCLVFLVYGFIFSLVYLKALAQLQLIDYIGEQTALLIKVSICFFIYIFPEIYGIQESPGVYSTNNGFILLYCFK